MSKLKDWLLEGYVSNVEGAFEQEHEPGHKPHSWWQVMCLTGVDYFSTLGYQPGIAALAAGALSPFATLVLVLLTLFGAFPIYKRVAQESPHGEGSISMLAALLTYWQGKLLVLVLLGFVATDFIITITLSAADASAHVLENRFLHHLFLGAPLFWQITITLALVLALSVVFLKGFKEAIGIAVVLVFIYLALNAVVVGRGLIDVYHHPVHFPQWKTALFQQHGSIPGLVLAALVLFPKLALGLSGFETGVAVMPLVEGAKTDTEAVPTGRIKNTWRLLLSAAVIMSVYLLSSSLVTTLLIKPGQFLPKMIAETTVTSKELSDGANIRLHPEGAREPALNVVLPPGAKAGDLDLNIPVNEKPDETVPVDVTVTSIEGGTRFHISAEKGPGEANGRALAYLAALQFGPVFGTIYDLSTILILWFAGASAMAGLLNIVPRYLPRFGMAPEWTRANRPLVLVYTAIAIVVTLIFKANVDAQGGAYATGVLVLMTSAAVAVTISSRRRGDKKSSFFLGIIAVVFAYTTIVNVIERSDGVKIASFFIGAVLLISVLSRIWRASELRVSKVETDSEADRIIAGLAKQPEVVLLANHPDERDTAEYSEAIFKAQKEHRIQLEERYTFVEIYIKDASNFTDTLRVEGHDIGGFWVLRCYGVAVPNAIAALALHVQKTTGRTPHVYFNWIEGSPLLFLGKFFLTGQGDIAPMTHEILRKAQPDTTKRPIIHAAG
ncbi:MAG: hypothetical protein QM758_07500 [Armatimonas sp.]